MAEMVGVVYTGGSLNPARSLGPAVVTHNFPGYRRFFHPLLILPIENAGLMNDLIRLDLLGRPWAWRHSCGRFLLFAQIP